jgi:microcystin degradation protein MlrC
MTGHGPGGRARILVASFTHEVNSFSPGRTTLADFRRQGWVTGADALAFGQGEDQLGGAASVAQPAGAELVPVLFAQGASGPAMTDEAYAASHDVILGAVREQRDRLDGIYLSLHGAMATESLSDPEGALLADVREAVGGAVPIAASFDLHAHFTAQKARSADIVAGFQTCPHVDQHRTGQRAMRMLLRTIETGTRPVLRYRKIRMLTSSEAHDTRRGAMHEVMLRRAELEQGAGILDISIFATQPWLDAPEVGWSVVVMAAADGEAAQACADELGEMLWERRERFRVHKTPIADVIAEVERARETGMDRPIIASDGADSISAGSRGDGVDMLRALLEAGSTARTLLSVTDAPGVAACFAAGVNATVDVDLGGTLSPEFHGPVRVSGRVATLCDGRYRSKYPPVPMDLGRAAVIVVGSISVVVTENPAYLLDQQLYRRVGLEPETFELVVVKSAGGYREHYEPIASRVFDIDTIGPADSDLTRLPFRRLDHPLWPFEADLDRPW